MTLRKLKPLALSSALLLCLSSPAWAQGIAGGSIDFSGNVGFSSLTGVDNSKHIQAGASAGMNVSRFVELGVDYEYKPLGSITLGGSSGNEHLQLIGVSLRAALDHSRRAVPYVVVGGGLADFHNFESLQKTLNGVVSTIDEDITQGGSYVTLGGGVSIYAGKNWGVRPEFRYQHQQLSAASVNAGYYVNSFSQSDLQGVVSVFFEFSK